MSNRQLFSLSNGGNTKTITEGITQRGSSEVVYRSFTSVPNDVYYWVLPQTFKGDKVGGKENNIVLRAERRGGGAGKAVKLSLMYQRPIVPRRLASTCFFR